MVVYTYDTDQRYPHRPHTGRTTVAVPVARHVPESGVGTSRIPEHAARRHPPMTTALLAIGALIPLAFGIAGALSVDYGNRGGL